MVMLLAMGPAVAGAQNVTFQTGTPFTTPGLTGFATRGLDMVGMQIRATFSDGTVRTGTWGQIGSSVLFGIIDPGFFELWMDGTQLTGSFTTASAWRLRGLSTTSELVSLTLNGALGRTLFDCRFRNGACDRTILFNDNGLIGTPGSSTGSELAFWDSYNLSQFNASNLDVVYSNLVGLGGTPPVGDLFEQISLTFKGLANTQFFRFDLDTDSSEPNAAAPSPAPPVTSVPEPGTVLLVAAGLGALAVARRRRGARNGRA